jgi:hypothetical protein
MLAQIPPDILSAIPSKYITYATAAYCLVTMFGRALHAAAAGGGLVTMFRAVLYGTNIPTPAESQALVQKKVAQLATLQAYVTQQQAAQAPTTVIPTIKTIV